MCLTYKCIIIFGSLWLYELVNEMDSHKSIVYLRASLNSLCAFFYS